jgi:hypothetical protein
MCAQGVESLHLADPLIEIHMSRRTKQRKNRLCFSSGSVAIFRCLLRDSFGLPRDEIEIVNLNFCTWAETTCWRYFMAYHVRAIFVDSPTYATSLTIKSEFDFIISSKNT